MGKEKAGFLTPKAIGNRIKAKGLQKLRWCVTLRSRQSSARRALACSTPKAVLLPHRSQVLPDV